MKYGLVVVFTSGRVHLYWFTSPILRKSYADGMKATSDLAEAVTGRTTPIVASLAYVEGMKDADFFEGGIRE